MDFVKNLKDILHSQKEILKQFEDELSSIEKLDVINENNSLKEEAENSASSLESLKAEHAQLKKEYAILKENFFSEIHSQKLNLLSFSKKRVFKLYEDFESKNYSELEHIELSAEEKLSAIHNSVASCNDTFKNDI